MLKNQSWPRWGTVYMLKRVEFFFFKIFGQVRGHVDGVAGLVIRGEFNETGVVHVVVVESSLSVWSCNTYMNRY